MSGFEYFVRCRACGLVSERYAAIYDRVVQPTQAELPVMDRATSAFDRETLRVEGQLEPAELRRRAAARSTSERTVCVPEMAYTGWRIEPDTRCPRCGSSSLECPFGTPRPLRVVATADDIVAQSRMLAKKTASDWALDGKALTITVARTPAGQLEWDIGSKAGYDQTDTVELAEVATAVTTALARVGVSVTVRDESSDGVELVESGSG